ncbi:MULTISPECIES: MFS transporter [unclassified Meiothermus]|uniref:MFS transporter n=1 Tax=unclassified Meiothermus TaxID=370471 RepID=UPI000D7C1225|nr:MULTISPECIES: MFS transporter [unclassified Meiothermus]PZA06114.1 MFS transporter [Meiothermus sp. Pnk-1]RYM35388.1 MFS transporter [Meiothermus sp. PNK-Is4]
MPAERSLVHSRIAISAYFVLHGLATGSWISRIPAEQECLALGAAVLGMVLLGNTAGALLAGLTSGGTVSRFGSRHVTRFAAMGSLLTLALLGLSGHAVGLFLGLVLFGLLQGTLNIAMNTQAAALEARYERPIFSSFHALWSAGALSGALLGASLAGLGLSPSLHFALVGAWGITVAAYAGNYLLAASLSRSRRAFVLPRGGLLALGLLGFCAAISDGAIASWSGVYLRSLGAPESVAALGFALYQSMMFLGRFSGDYLVARFGAVRLVRLGALLGGFGLAFAVLTHTVWGIFVGIACMGWGMATVFPLMFAASARTPGLPPAHSMASASTMSTLGGLVGPVLLGAVAEVGTVRASFAVAALLAWMVSYLAFSLSSYRVTPARS